MTKDVKHLFTVFRREAGLSQFQLGKQLGIKRSPQSRVTSYETGRTVVPPAVARSFIKLAKRYGQHYSLDDVYEPVKQRRRAG